MDGFCSFGRGVLGMALALAAPLGSLHAQEAASVDFSNSAELTLVLTAGNASSSTLGFKNTAELVRGKQGFKLSLGAVRTESGITTRTASGTPENFTVSETTESEITAENYFVKGRFDQALSDAAVFFTGAEWDRNTFAGIQNRYGFIGGAGRKWYEEETRHFKTDAGVTYTIQKDVVEVPDTDDSSLGLRATLDLLHPLTETAAFTSLLAVDQNLETTKDLRADWTNALTVAMSERLALKTSLQLLFDNEPALASVPLGDGEVLTPLGKTDTVFTVAIVANF